MKGNYKPAKSGTFTPAATLPDDLSADMLDAVARRPSSPLASVARRCIGSSDSRIRGRGLQLLAASRDPAFPDVALSDPPAMETSPLERYRYMALAVALYDREDEDLRLAGAARLSAWDARERDVKERYTKGQGFSLAAPEQPCLDSESVFARLAWLAYLVRWAPERYGESFAREWLMVDVYRGYCNRTIAGLWQSLKNATPQQTENVKVKVAAMYAFSAMFDRLGRITRPVLDTLIREHPEAAARGFARAHFLLEIKRCMNVLGDISPGESCAMLERLRSADDELLARFAGVRLATAGL